MGAQIIICTLNIHPSIHHHSPVAFGKKYDKEGVYIKQYLPILSKYPAKYIFEPWKAPIADQRKWGCVIGEHYPRPIVDHDVASKECKEALKKFFADKKAANDEADEDDP